MLPHLRYLSEFVDYVQKMGGTTPHLTMVVEAAKDTIGRNDKLWKGGCYAATYNYAAAEALWNSLDYQDVNRMPLEELSGWLMEHWAYIPLRKERKAVNSSVKLARCLKSFAQWELDFTFHSAPDQVALFEKYWQDFGQVEFMGRYISIRFLEFLRRVFNLNYYMPDIRPVDGKYPRQALSLIYPQYSEELNGNNSAENIKIVNMCAAWCKEELAERYGVVTDYYTLQSLLCEYKQSVLGKHQYPGRSIDSELKYFMKVYRTGSPFDAGKSKFFEIRLRSFPTVTLGEHNGWYEPREPLNNVLVDYGYTWSDLLYDYNATVDFSNPVRRNVHEVA